MLWHSSRRFLLRHPAQCALALLGIAAGISVITGILLLRGALADSLDAAGEALAGSDGLRIVAPTAMDEDAYARLARLDGAPDMLPLIRVQVRVNDRPLQILGVDAAAVPELRGIMGREDAVILTAATARNLALTPGDAFSTSYRGRPLELEVAAVAPMQRAFDGHILMDIAAAQVHFGRPGVIDELWAPAAGADWLAHQLPEGWIMQMAEDRRAAAERLTRGMRANLLALSGLALAVGLFVAYSVLSFLYVQRKRAFGVLRAVGVAPGQLAGLIAREALLFGALGGLLGICAGTWLAQRLLWLVRDPVVEIYRAVPATTTQGGFGLYAAILLLSLAAALAAAVPVIRETLRLPPLRWLRFSPPRAAGFRMKSIGGVATLAAGGILCIAFSNTLIPAQIGLFLLLAAFALAIPAAGVFLLGRLARISGSRALALLAAGAQRVRPALAALGLAIAVTAGIGMMVSGFRAGVDDWISRLLRADAYLTLQQGVIDGAAVARVDALPGVAAVSSARRIRLADGRNMVAYDLPEAAWGGFEWLERREGARGAFLEGRAAAVTEPFARRHELSLGDTVTVPAPGRMLTLPVVGIFRDYSTDRGFIAVDGAFYREHWRDEVRDNLGLYFTPDGDPAAIEAYFSDRAPRLTSAGQLREQTLAIFDNTFRVTQAMQALVGLIALIALISSLLALALERARDYATLRALGMTRLRLGLLVIAQTTGLALVAAVLAVPAAVLLHWALAAVIQPRAFGWTVPLTWPLGALALTVISALLAGFLAGLYPAWRIARQPPGRALREAV